MQNHYEESATDFDVQVFRGFVTLRPDNYSLTAGEKTRHFRTTGDDKLLIRVMVADGSQKSQYAVLNIQSNSERVFAITMQGDSTVEKWLKPAKGDFRIYYAHDDEYVPDFAVEPDTVRYLGEPKSAAEMKDKFVLAEAWSALLWCQRATEHACGKPWKYLLIPHDAINETKTLAGLRATWDFHG
jgi:type III restriction enzyme